MKSFPIDKPYAAVALSDALLAIGVESSITSDGRIVVQDEVADATIHAAIAAHIANPVPPPAPPAPLTQTITWESASVGTIPQTVATGIKRGLTGKFLAAAQSGAVAGGAVPPLARGASVTLQTDGSNTLVLSLDRFGRLTIAATGGETFTVTLDLLGI